jgi:hypothetical protein
MSVRHTVRHACIIRASGGRGLPLIPPGVRHACTPVRVCGVPTCGRWQKK